MKIRKEDAVKKRRLVKALLIATAVLLFVIAAVLIFIYFTPQGYRMTVFMHGYHEILDGVWLDDDFSGDIDEVCDIVFDSRDRVNTFFGEITSKPCLIITENERKLRRIGGEHDIVTFAVGEVYSYISVATDSLNVDVTAHELMHAETHKRLYDGKVTFKRGVPAWFDEGIALQADYDVQYRWSVMLEYTEDLSVLPEFSDFADEDDFYAEDTETRLYHYVMSKHEIGCWLLTYGGEQAMVELIEKLNAGGDFDELYGKPILNKGNERNQ